MPAALLLLLLHYCYRVTWGHIRIVRKKPHIYGWDRDDVYLVYICVPITNHFWFLLTLMCVSVCVLNGHLHAFIITKSSTCNVCTYKRETDIKSGRMQGCMHHHMNYNLKHSDREHSYEANVQRKAILRI